MALNSKSFDVIVAVDSRMAMGMLQYGTYGIPWANLKEDMAFFKKITSEVDDEANVNVIIMGYTTWTTLPMYYKKNNRRHNIVLSTRQHVATNGEEYCTNFDSALVRASHIPHERIVVIGGRSVYKVAIGHYNLRNLYMTNIKINSYEYYKNVEKMIYFPIDLETIGKTFETKEKTEYFDVATNIKYSISRLTVNDNPTEKDEIKFAVQEEQYLSLVRKIMSEGINKNSRNGAIRSVFGHQMRFNIENYYPIWTVKRSFPKAIFEELMWMIRGQTNNKLLKNKGVHIWDKNSTAEYHEEYKLPLEEDDIGAGYGFQMRHFGAKYVDCNTDYTGQGFDQLQYCINEIKTNPDSRRILINLWNPCDLHMMAVPPCHIMYHFEVVNGKLNCHLFQRSWDVMLGWNTTTAALLTYILAHFCGLTAGILVHSISDAHLYHEHIENKAIERLLEREVGTAPELSFNCIAKENIEDYQFEDMTLKNYFPAPAIVANMVA
jgi:dihydrofolate reductase/thymidylate synthase